MFKLYLVLLFVYLTSNQMSLEYFVAVKQLFQPHCVTMRV